MVNQSCEKDWGLRPGGTLTDIRDWGTFYLGDMVLKEKTILQFVSETGKVFEGDTKAELIAKISERIEWERSQVNKLSVDVESHQKYIKEYSAAIAECSYNMRMYEKALKQIKETE